MSNNKNIIITDGNIVVQPRLHQLSDSTFLLLSLDFSQRPTVQTDGKIVCPEIDILLPACLPA